MLVSIHLGAGIGIGVLHGSVIRPDYPIPYTLLQENIIEGQSWPAASVSDFDASAFPDLSKCVVIQQAPLGLPPTL